MNILCVDQSLDKFGYCIINVNENKCVIKQYGVIRLNQKINYFDRIVSLNIVLDNLIKEFSIDAIQAEDIQMQRGVTTYKKLASLLFYLECMPITME